MALRLNLGSSDDHKNGFINVDRAEPADVIWDLDTRWPWDDSTADVIYAHDVFEHLGRRATNEMGAWGKAWPMNEAHRVLKPGGILDLAVPCVCLKDGRVNPGAFADPTHVTFWTLDDRYYFGEEWNNPRGERGRLGPAYGITAVFRGEWRLEEYGQGPERRSKIFASLEAVK
jgi:SAM-dependent methyltransferase